MTEPGPGPRSARGDRSGRRGLLVALAAMVGLGGAAAAANEFTNGIDEPATAAIRAERLVRAAVDGDVVTVFNIGELRPDVGAAVEAAAASANASWSPTRSASVGLIAVRRGAQFVQQAPPGFRYPLIVTAMPAPVAGAVLGTDVGAVLSSGVLVMGQRTADLRGARTGDEVDVLGADGSVQTFRIGLVVPDVQVGGAEVVMSTAGADRLGITRETRAVVWGFSSRTAIDASFSASGIPAGLREVRAVRSWDSPNPDSTLTTARTKELLGEFAFRPDADGSMTQEAAWGATYLPPGRELLNDVIRVRARCHHEVAADLRAALAEVAAAGLAAAIDVGNANTSGGCHNPRFNRISGELGFVSRHAWAMAFDTNTVTNAQGRVPRMNCDVVRIFRRHGFAWGGNFLRPDGMHFEWVGVRRDQISYPSNYCPNVVPPSLQSIAVGDSRELLFADDTLTSGHDHGAGDSGQHSGDHAHDDG